MSQSNWLSLRPLEFSKYAAPCLLNDEYIILAPNNNKGNVYSCHLEQNKMYNICKLGIEPLRHSLIVDNHNKKIYIYTNSTTSTDIFFEIDFRNQSYITYRGIIHGLPEGLGYESGGDVQLCLLNNTIHAIGGHTKTYHCIWKNKINDKINSFSQHSIGNRPSQQSLYGHSLIVISSLEQILILGGKDNALFSSYLKDIWVCEAPKQSKEKHMISWTKLEKTTMPHRMCDFGCILTNDQKFILIFGGKTASGLSNEIWILSTSTWEWKKSSVKCPKKSRFYAIITSKDDIHLFGIEQDKHWKIKLSQLILNDIFDQNLNGSSTSINSELEEKKEAQKKADAEKLSVQYMKLHDDKHYEETINELRSTNNHLTEHVVDITDKLETLQKKYDLLHNKFVDNEKGWKSKYNSVWKDYKGINEKYEILLEKEKKRTLDDTRNYKNWSYVDIVYWLSYLEKGRFEKYLKTLEKNLKIEKITGEYLTDLDKHDIHRLGCTEYGDKKALLKHFKSLKNTKSVWNENAMFAHIVI